MPIHALGEALIVLPFGFTLQKAGMVVGIGSALHHGVDSLIALVLYATLSVAMPKIASQENRA